MGVGDRHARVLERVRAAGSVRVSELAKEFQVSPMTVRRDLDELASAGALRRTRGGAAVADGAPVGAPVSPPARGGAHIGVVVPNANYVYRSIINGVNSALRADGSTSQLLVSDYDCRLERQLVDDMIASVDGLLFTPSLDEATGEIDVEFVEWMTELSAPVVLIERALPPVWPGRSLSSVCTSFGRGLALAVNHLAALGHCRIAFFGHARRMNKAVLRQLWRDVLEAQGPRPRLDVESCPVIVDPGYQNWHTDAQPDAILSTILDSGVTALICRDDTVTLRMAHHIRRRGLRIPDDLSVVTYDDEMATMCDPPLTAVAPPKDEIGRRACGLLIEEIRRRRGGEPPLVSRLDLEPSIVVRGSTGPAQTREQGRSDGENP